MRKTLESIILPLFGRWNRCQHKSSQTTIFFCICRWLRRQRFAKKWRQERSQKLGNNCWSWHIVLMWVWAIAIVLVLLQNLLLFWDTTHHIIDDIFVELWNASTYGRYILRLGCRARQSLRISQAVVFFDYRCGIEKWLHILRQRERAMSDALNTLIGKKGPN